MGALTDAMPKPMLEVGGKPLLQYKFEALPDEVTEVILVVCYYGHVVQQYFGGEYLGRRVLYVEQSSPTGGTADALWCAKDILENRFIVMNGDNLYGADDIAACLNHEWAVVVQEKESVATGRVIVEDGLVKNIVENSDHAGERGYANTGLYALDRRIFDFTPVPKAPGSTELGLPQTMMQALGKIDVHAIPASFWFEIKSPEDIAQAEMLLQGKGGEI